MKFHFKDVWALLKDTYKEWSEDKAARLAAALAYYTVFSLAPLLVIVIALVGLFIGSQQSVQNQILQQFNGLVGAQGSGLIRGMIEGTRNKSAGIFATVIGIVTLILGAAGLFGQLQDALNTIWEVAPNPNRGILGVIKDRFLSFTMVLGVGFLLLVSLILTAVLAAIGTYFTNLLPGWTFILQVANFVFSFLIITLLFALIFKVLPDAHIAWRDVWLGGAVTSLLFVIGRAVIGFYMGNSRGLSVYGAAGSIVILLLWVYYSAQILFFGAEFTQVYANKYGSHIVPDKKAIPLTNRMRAQQGIPRQSEVALAAVGKDQAEKKPPVSSQIHPAVLPATGAANPPGTTPVLRGGRAPELLPEVKPSILAFSAVLATLVGFVGGFLARQVRPRSD